MKEEIRKQMIYLASVDVLRRLAKTGTVEIRVLERLNRKNAEKMGCRKHKNCCFYGRRSKH